MKMSKNVSVGYQATDPIFGPFALWLAQLCKIDKRMHVLDVGCGIGVSTFPLLEKVGRTGKVMGLDISPDLISQALEMAVKVGVSNISFMVGNAEQLDFPDNTFDSVMSNFVLRQVNDKVKALQEMKRVLKPGGHLGFTLSGSDHYKEFRSMAAMVLKEDLFRPRQNCLRTDPDALPLLLEKSQITNIKSRSKTITLRINSVEKYDAILETRGPKKMILSRIKEERRGEIWKEILNELGEKLEKEGRLYMTIHASAIIWRKPLVDPIQNKNSDT